MQGLLKVFEKQASINKNKTAIICGGKKLSYEELYFKAYNLSLFFKKEGLKLGEKIVVKSEETPLYWVIYFATLLSDGVFVALDKNISDNTFDNVVKELGGCFAYVANSKNEISNDKYYSYEKLLEESKELPTHKDFNLYHDIEAGRLIQIIYTTGTTGKAKGVKLPYQRQLISSTYCDELPYNQDTTIAVIAPLDHTFANGMTTTALLHGSTVIQFNDLSNLETFYDELEKYNVNSFALTPSAIKYLSIISYDYFKNVCSKAIFFQIGGEKFSRSSQEDLLTLAPNARLFIGYAATECGFIGFYEFSKYGPTDNRVRSFIGAPEISLFDDKLEPIGNERNVSGFIGIKKNFEYLGYCGSTSKDLILKNDFIVLSDYGHIDDDGFLCLDGRDGETIVSGGYKINPVEVENVALKYEGIDDCVCYGITNDIFGKIVALDIVSKTGVDKNDLNNHLLKYLEVNKLPKIISVVDKIERNKMGKIDRKFYRR